MYETVELIEKHKESYQILGIVQKAQEIIALLRR